MCEYYEYYFYNYIYSLNKTDTGSPSYVDSERYHSVNRVLGWTTAAWVTRTKDKLPQNILSKL